ncbi:hypothetical protein BGZ65_001299 [Modicella reniformis]|uniref:Uncharacterized protein n=1 Tax=Modicella reniformis TaxID=1440133 RepID=A0A9P6MJ56_9FUNG|nr:hypothetical protein BGZ65_001299 [Modicella reniformis]
MTGSIATGAVGVTIRRTVSGIGTDAGIDIKAGRGSDTNADTLGNGAPVKTPPSSDCFGAAEPPMGVELVLTAKIFTSTELFEL